ncbi:MAG: hypothetical protein DWP95_00060 [Proteobacteria bacterium]|nr:MAG: hypothetical protein DWP95_00060 [Pseudomonadota bacterium]
MISVIKGDIVASRQLENPNRWLQPLKALFNQWGRTPAQWELVWGDSFQLEVTEPATVLHKALAIKALIKQIMPEQSTQTISPLDVRMGIGMGAKSYAGERVSESNGPAFIYAGEAFEQLQKSKTNLAVKSPWSNFDEEMNLYLKLAGIFMDDWSVLSAQLVAYVLNNPEATQTEIGAQLGIKQNSVSGRWHRARINELQEVESVFRQRLQENMA